MTEIIDAPALPGQGLDPTDLADAADTVAPPAGAPLAVPGAGVPLIALGLAFATVGAACVWTAGHVHPDPVLHDVALFFHLASLIVGFGAVLTVDWVALLWVVRRRELADVLHAAGSVHAPIWIGYGGLVLSGVLLEPNPTDQITQLKLALVLVIGWNGLTATWLHHRLQASASLSMLAISALSASVSQVAWWGATAIGFANAH